MSVLAAARAEVLGVVVVARTIPGELEVHTDGPAIPHFDGLADATGSSWGT